MRILIADWIGVAWLIFFIIWMAAAFTNKRSVQRQSTGSRLLQTAIMLLGVALIFNFGNWITSGWLAMRVVPAADGAAIAGAALTAIGFLFAFWARAVLGRNWSGTVTIKENHTLISRGPYRFVRHPIYTGLVCAFLGSVILYGYVRCFVGLLLVTLSLWLKSQIEEQFMVQQFGEQYVHYRTRVRALVPFAL